MRNCQPAQYLQLVEIELDCCLSQAENVKTMQVVVLPEIRCQMGYELLAIADNN